jgi:hypothetical protein
LRYTFEDIDVRPLGLPVFVLSALERPFRTISQTLPDWLHRFLMLNPLVPARSPTIATPRANRPASTMLAELRASISLTRAAVEANADLDLEAMRIDHPITGMSNVGDILVLLARHELRHQRQMEGVRSAAGFPGTRGAW